MTELIDINYLQDIKSAHIRKGIFSFVNEKQKLKLIIHNKLLQKLLGYDIEDYKEISGKQKIGGRNGKGREYNLKTKKLIFKGEYLNGERNGKGKEYDQKGKIFEGEYYNGKKNGKGIEFYHNKKKKFEGDYLNGKNGMEKDIIKKVQLNIKLKMGKGK